MDATTWIGLLLLTGLVPLLAQYRPTKSEQALGHPLRRRVVKALRERPMSTKNHLRSRLDTSWSSVHHHVAALKRSGLITSMRIGGRERYFVCDEPRRSMQQIAVLRSRRVRELASFIASHPGTVQATLTRELSIHRKVLRAYVDRLVEAGLVEENRDGRFQVYNPTPRLEPALDLQADGSDLPPHDEGASLLRK